MPSLWHTRPSKRRRRKSALAGSFLVILLCIFVFYRHPAWSRAPKPPKTRPHATDSSSSSSSSNPLLQERARFWRSIYHLILNNDPQCLKAPEVVVPAKLDIAYQDDHVHHRPDIMWMDEPDIQRMKVAHSNLLNDIRASNLQIVFDKGTRGIVITVSDSQLPVLLIALRMIRQTTSILPVEVFLWQPTPYTDNICSNILPNLSATCIYLSQIFVEAETVVHVETYQYKIFAILFSSFDELLFLDADSWPVTSPDPLFTVPPFTNTGLVLWPDFWYASESPYFFSIAKIDDPPGLSERAATEAGEMMYCKSKQELGIMLATYYNYYGPQYYYPLQSQGAPGQGDKETFRLAAMAVGSDFYSVKTGVTALGRGDSNGQFLGSAMVQYNPIIDLQVQSSSLPHPGPKIVFEPEPSSAYPTTDPVPTTMSVEDLNYRNHANPPPSILQAAVSFNEPSSSSENSTTDPSSKPMFIHANYPKFDPRTIFEDGIGGAPTPTRDTNGTNVRCWGMTSEVAVERFGYDVEERFWSVIWKVACHDLIGEGSKDQWKGEKERQVCRRVEEYVREIFPHARLI